MRTVLPAMLVASLAVGQSVQRAPTPPPVYGSVSGHITCADTNQPARLASVTLQSIAVKPPPSPSTTEPRPAMMRTYQTTLDGSFFIPKVTSGTYYVVIQAPGYISPITSFTQIELQQPTAEILTRILKVVPTITITPNQTVTLDTRIDRGAEFSGTIRYDDGTPVAGKYVDVFSKEHKEGKEAWVSNHEGNTTDDRGHFRITGLPSGEYLLCVDLRIFDTYVSNILGGSRTSMTNSKYALSFYSGDVARKDKGKPMKPASSATVPTLLSRSVSSTALLARSPISAAVTSSTTARSR